MAYSFEFEDLTVYRRAVDVARWVRSARWPSGQAKLKDQASRAADSIALNIAEGRLRTGRARSNHYEIARASAGETYAALDLVDLPGAETARDHLRQIARMLHALR